MGLSGINGLREMPDRTGQQQQKVRESGMTGVSFRKLVDRHLDEIGRAQAAYLQYKSHGRDDLADGARKWASRHRDQLNRLGLGPHVYQPGVDLSWRFTSKHQADEAPAYDYTQQGRQVKPKERQTVARKAAETYRAAAAEPQPTAKPGILHSAPAEVQNGIVQAARQVGIDPHLIASVAFHESGFREEAQSNKGAIGLLQLMPDTAKTLGINPYDPLSNLVGGATYLKEQLKRYDGDLRLALAAYNAGPGRVDEALSKAENRMEWETVLSFLPQETQTYVAKVLDTYL